MTVNLIFLASVRKIRHSQHSKATEIVVGELDNEGEYSSGRDLVSSKLPQGAGIGFGALPKFTFLQVG